MNRTFTTFLIIFIAGLSGFFGSYFFQTYHLESNPLTIQEITQDDEKISIQQLENNITDIVELVSPGVVNIIATKDISIYKNDPYNYFHQPVENIKKKIGGGTGFFITKEGLILTNKHVIEDSDAKYSVILNNGEEFSANILMQDPNTDLAIININSNEEFIPLEFAYKSINSEIKIGQFAIAIGNIFSEYHNSVSLGIISGLNRTIEDNNGKISGLLQTDANINPGNSGGPLIDLDGKVMGINTAILNYQDNVSFAIPLSQIKINTLLQSLESRE